MEDNNVLKTMLMDTVKMMESDNNIDNFVAEYMQTKVRHTQLHRMIIKMEAKTLEYTPKSSLLVLQNQLSYMGQYIKVLEIRAELEGIDLPKFFA